MNISRSMKQEGENSWGCTGCTACMNICSSKAINMRKSKEGFFEAYVDEQKCSECGECVQVCHSLQKDVVLNSKRPLYYAAFSKDIDNILQSSSGGIFNELSKSVLAMKGAIYGAVQKSVFEVVHQRGESLEKVELFRRSKYRRRKA